MILVGLVWSMVFGLLGIDGNPINLGHMAAHCFCFLMDGGLKTVASLCMLTIFNNAVDSAGKTSSFGAAYLYKKGLGWKGLSDVGKLFFALAMHIWFDCVQGLLSLFATNIGKFFSSIVSKHCCNVVSTYARRDCCCPCFRFVMRVFLVPCEFVEEMFLEGLLLPALHALVQEGDDPEAKKALVNSLVGRAHRKRLLEN